MTDTSEHLATIAFHGRQIDTKRPSPGQLSMIPVVLRRIQKLRADNISGDEASKAMDKVTLIIRSIMVDPDDYEWLEDSVLLGKIEPEDMLRFLTDTARTWKTPDAEETTPEPAKKAVRTARKSAPKRQ